MNRQKVERELDSARVALHAAQARYRAAVENMDVVINAEAQAQKKRDAASDIKAYQQSEALKREQGLWTMVYVLTSPSQLRATQLSSSPL